MYTNENQLVWCSESTGDRRKAAGQPEARDHVTITRLSDGRVSKLRKPDYPFS